MSTPLAILGRALLLGAALTVVGCSGSGCGSKTPEPATTTTTHTTKSTVHDTGEATTSDVKETRTEQPNGSEQVERTETTTTTSPPPATPAPSPK